MTTSTDLQMYYGKHIAFFIMLSSIAYLMLNVNQFAPFHRDGSLFLFMANNIAHGQTPY